MAPGKLATLQATCDPSPPPSLLDGPDGAAWRVVSFVELPFVNPEPLAPAVVQKRPRNQWDGV